MDDLISRQAVNILVDELARAISDERCCISRGRSTATIMQDILDLPSVKLQEPKVVPIAIIKFDDDMLHEIVEEAVKNIEIEPKWIPVSEPPKELGTYLIQTDGEPYMCKCRWTDVNPFWTDYKTKPHWNIFDLPQYSKVVAWMPLPKPYKAKSEE